MAGMSDNLVLVIIGIVLLAMVLLLRRMTAGKRGQRITLDVDTSVHSGLAAKRAPKAPAVAPSPTPAPEPAPLQEIPPAAAAPKSTDADNLTRIKGIGPKIADLLQREGVRHFSQIAGWTEADLAAIDAKLGNFSGRPMRDQWIEQAKLLANGDDKAFEAKFGALGGR